MEGLFAGHPFSNLTSPEHKLEPTILTLIRIYEKLAHCAYEKHCVILRLNSEMLAPIFKFLETEDRKNVRLTCRVFKDAIDNQVGMHVDLDKRKIESMQEFSLPPPGASSIRIWSINNSKYLDYLLRKPDLTKNVVFSGQINLSVFTKIVSRCKNLEKLSFTDRCHLYANIVPMSMNNLHTLDIGCPGHSSDYVGEDTIVPSLWITYEILMRRLIAPNLKVLRIFFCSVEECSVLHNAIAQIFRFVAVHNKVKDLSINLHHRYERFNFLEGDVNYRCFRIDVPKKILRRIQFEKLHIETMEPAFKVWDSILPAQKALKEIDILNKGRRWFYFSKIVSNNYANLRVARLHNISSKRTKTPILNAGIFEGCQVLETLFLSRFENSTQQVVYCYPNENSEFSFLDTETSRTLEMENLTKLPVTLKNFHIQGLVLSSSELAEAIPRLQNLQVLELQLTGYHMPPVLENGRCQTVNYANGLGVTASVIKSIIHNCRKLEILFIEEFENEWTKVRGTEFGNKLHKISHVAGDGYFEDGGYFGILICSSIPKTSNRLTRSERMHLWGVRLSQYCISQDKKINRKRKNINSKRYVRDGVKDLAELDEQNWYDESSEDLDSLDDDDEDDESAAFSVFEPPSSTNLIGLLDKENGKLEQIQRMLNAGCTPPRTPTKAETERTQRIAKEYRSTLFSAIPNYHKASRLQLDPTEKFASFFPRSKTKSQFHLKTKSVIKRMQNSQKLLEKN